MNEAIRVAVTVPNVPSAKLLPNCTAHYLTKSKLRRALRLGAADAVTDEARADLERARQAGRLTGRERYALDVEVVWPKGRRIPDLDGALSSCKSLLDGIADAIEIDDRYCDEITIRQRRASKSERGHVLAAYYIIA